MHYIWILIAYSIMISFVIYVTGIVVYIFLINQLLQLYRCNKRKDLISASMEEINIKFSVEKAEKDENIREDREQMLIKSGLKPYEILYYQKKLKGGKKNGISEGTIKTKVRGKEIYGKYRNRTKEFFGRIFRRKNRTGEDTTERTKKRWWK